MASQTRLKLWQQVDGEMLRVVDDDALPGDLAVACVRGQFLLFVSRRALRRRPLREMAHQSAHMLHGTSLCGLYCRGLTARLESCLSSRFAATFLKPLALTVLALAGGYLP